VSPRQAAFTLLEVVAVVLILGLVFLVMGSVYRNTVAPTARSPSQAESARRGLLLLDRIARDLEGATLVEKPDAVDPLAHPWLFLAESRRSGDGADRLKFDSRTAQSGAEHAGDLAVVAYWVEPGEADDLRLVRWTSPALPESLERELPRSSDPDAQIVANGIARFGVRFVDDEGAQVSTWDSSTLERSSQLPVSAEIRLALLDETAPEGEREFSKRVLLPLRPIDLEKALSGEEEEGEEEDEEEDGCVTVGQCVAANAAAFNAFLSTQPDPAAVQATVDSLRDECWAAVQSSFGIDLGSCE
jgi:hypothetical protein